MKLTENELNKAIESDIEKTIQEIVRCSEQIKANERLLSENMASKQDVDRINEGLWEKIKYGLSKLGRYKAGGKIFGKGKIDQEAGAKIQSIIDKKGNEVIKALNSKLKETNPEFPNNEKGNDFLKTVLEISAVYDTIVASTKKDSKEEGFLPIDIANGIIEDLAEYVKKFLDVDLTAAYSVMDSKEDEVDSETGAVIDPETGEKDGDKKLIVAGGIIGEEDEHDAGDVRTQLQAKKGEGGKNRDNERMKGLKSNKLPMLLLGIGSSLGAFSWLVHTEWFKHLFEEVYQYTSVEKIKHIIETKTEVLNAIKPNEGVYKFVGGATHHTLNASSSPEEMIEAFKQIGGGDASKGVDLLCQKGGVMMNPQGAAKGLHDLVDHPDKYKNLGQLFNGEASGTGKLVDPNSGLNTTLYGTIAGRSMTSMLVEKLPVIIIRTVTKTGIKMGGGYAVAKGFGAVLGPIGIGVLAAGALVKLMRMKGQKQSRAKTLNDLLQSIQPVKAGEATTVPVLPEDPNKEKGGDIGNGKGGSSNSEVYQDVVGLLKFVTNNGSTVKNTEKEQNSCSKLQNGIQVSYKFKSGKQPGVDKAVVTKVFPEENLVQIRRNGNTKQQVVAVKCSEVKPLGNDGEQLEIPFEESIDKKNINYIMENLLLTEGKFIKSPELIKALNNSGLDSKKIKFFEGFLTRLEIIRNRIKKMKPTGDEVMDRFIKKLQSNEIMKTNFTNTFNVNPKKEQSVKKMVSFIESYLEFIYKIDYKKRIGFNINKLEESYRLKEGDGENKKRESLGLKRSSVKFMADLINLFKRMYQLKKEGKSNGGNKDNKGDGGQKMPGNKQESTKKINPLIKEEVEKMKDLFNRMKK